MRRREKWWRYRYDWLAAWYFCWQASYVSRFHFNHIIFYFIYYKIIHLKLEKCNYIIHLKLHINNYINDVIWTWLLLQFLKHSYLFFINVCRYAQLDRINKNIKPLAKKVHKLGELFTTNVYNFLQPSFTSWIQLLENLYPTTIPRKYGDIWFFPFGCN